MDRQPRKRRRPALSCIECRRRKIRCDRNDPCQHCVSAQSHCAYSSTSNGLIYQNPHTLGSGATSTTCTVSEESPLQQVARTNETSGTRDSTSGPTYAATYTLPVVGLNRDSTGLTSLDTRIPDRDHHHRTRCNMETGKPGQDNVIILNKITTPRWSDWMGMNAEEHALIIGCHAEAIGHGDGISFQSNDIRPLIMETRQLLQDCKSIARSVKLTAFSKCLSSSDFNLLLPSRELADQMVSLYFRYFESVYRILHKPTFWNDYRRFWCDPKSVTPNLRHKILLVVVLGSSLSDHPATDPTFLNMVYQWTHDAQEWLSGPIKKDRLNLNGLQIHCMTLLARQTFSIGGELAWMSSGLLIHEAMQIGLHRDPKHLPPMSVLQAELRRRLWATIVEMAVQSSLDSGMPPRISPGEFDTLPPSNVDDSELVEDTGACGSHPKDDFTATSIQLLLLDSLSTRLRILRLINGVQPELAYPAILALSAEITEAYRKCNMSLAENKHPDITPFHRNMLQYFVRRCIIPLHAPFAMKARSNPMYHYSLKPSLDCAMSIVFPEPDEAFSRLTLTGAGLFREGFKLAGMVICLELYAQVNSQRLDGTLYNGQHIDILKQAVQKMVDLSFQQIQQGDTKSKIHVFLSMILAQAEAIEKGEDVELRIAQGGKASLQACHELLQTRWGAVTPIGSVPDDYVMDLDLDLDLDFFFPDANI